MSKFTKFLPAIAIIIAAIVVVTVAVAVTTGDNTPTTVTPGGDSGVSVCAHTGGKRTCTEPAVCTLCGEKYGEARGHVSSIIPAVPATCTESGLTQGEECLYCGTVLKAQQTVQATGHNMISVSAEAAGCTTDGHTAHSACTNCDYTEGKTIIPAAHSFIDVAALDATCTDDGYTAHKYCTVCEETEGKEILPAGHSFSDPDANGTRVCSACGLVEVSTYEGLVAALETDNANIVMANDIEGTATESSGYAAAGIVLNSGDLLDGNGYKLTINGANTTWACAVAMKGGEVRNLTISGATRGVFMPGANGDVVIDNCVFVGVIYTFNSDAGSKDYAVTVKNTTLNGWTSFSNVHKSVTFENCTFGKGSGYEFCRPYQATTFTGCTFDEGFEIDISRTAGLVFDECTFAGEVLTVDTAVDLFVTGGTVEIDGTEAHYHNWKTDTNTGIKTCTLCGVIETSTIEALQAAIDAATGNAVIEISANLQGDLTITQKPDVSITIEGNGHEFNGSIIVDGKSARYSTASATIQNLVFNAEGISADACVRLGNGNNATRYTNGITVKNCTFNGVNNEKVAVKSYTGGDHYVVIEGCTVNAGMHSLAQLTNVEKGLKIIDCKVYSKNGANLNNTLSLEMSGCEFDVTGYAIRFGVNGSVNADAKSFNISDSTLKSACADSDDAVIVFRSSSTNSVLNLTNTTLEGSVEFYGNTEATMICIDGMVAVKTAQQLASVVAMGYDNIWLEDGEYNIASCGNKTLTISGTRNAVIKVYNEGEDGCDYGFDGSTVTFNGVTIDTTANTGNYKGYARLQATFNDCAFFGAYTAHRVQTFNNCEFDFNNGYFWVWGSTELNFNGCVFGGNSKAILAHGGASTVININNCNFAATAQGFTGSGDNTAAIEIDPTGSNVYTINFTGDNTITGSYAGWTRVKDGSTGHVVTGLE